jgi:hypothetical protein
VLRLLTALVAAAAVSTSSLAAADPAAAASCTFGLVCIAMDVPAPLAFGTKNAATTTDSADQTVTISASASWGIKVSTDLADGKMKEWTGAAYVGAGAKVMHNPLQFRLSAVGASAQSTTFAMLSGTAATLVSGQPTTCALLLCNSTTIAAQYRLQTSFFDPNAGSNDYRIQVTYDAQLGF